MSENKILESYEKSLKGEYLDKVAQKLAIYEICLEVLLKEEADIEWVRNYIKSKTEKNGLF